MRKDYQAIFPTEYALRTRIRFVQFLLDAADPTIRAKEEKQQPKPDQKDDYQYDWELVGGQHHPLYPLRNLLSRVCIE